MPGADIFPEGIGLFYSVARLNVERTVAYSVAVAIPTSMGNPIVVNKTFKQLGSNVFKLVRRETTEVTENVADDLLLDFVEIQYSKNAISETDYLALKAKRGEELKAAIDDVLKGVGGRSFKRLLNKSSLDATAFNKLDNTLSTSTSIKFDYNGTSQTAKQFFNEQGDNMFDIILDNGTYVKYDMSNGRMLLNDGDYYVFVNYTKGNNLTTLEAIEQTILDRATKLRNCVGLDGSQKISLIDGTLVTTKTDKVTTFIGKTTETQLLKNQFGDFKHIQVGETTGSVNLLNMPDTYWKPATWFKDYNKDWMLRAINRGDDIYIASPINTGTLFNVTGEGKRFGSYFANELNELVEANIKPINISQTEWDLLISEIKKAAAMAP